MYIIVGHLTRIYNFGLVLFLRFSYFVYISLLYRQYFTIVSILYRFSGPLSRARGTVSWGGWSVQKVLRGLNYSLTRKRFMLEILEVDSNGLVWINYSDFADLLDKLFFIVYIVAIVICMVLLMPT